MTTSYPIFRKMGIPSGLSGKSAEGIPCRGASPIKATTSMFPAPDILGFVPMPEIRVHRAHIHAQSGQFTTDPFAILADFHLSLHFTHPQSLALYGAEA